MSLKKSILSLGLASGVIASLAVGAVPASAAQASAAALPSGCHTGLLDGSRTAYASCGFGSYTHHVWCSYGGNINGIHKVFNISNEISCPGRYRVSSQTISEN